MHVVTGYTIVGVITEGWPATSKRQKGKAAKLATRRIAAAWHSKHLPQHFHESAERRYGIKARSVGHNKKKKRRFGHTTPLV